MGSAVCAAHAIAIPVADFALAFGVPGNTALALSAARGISCGGGRVARLLPRLPLDGLVAMTAQIGSESKESIPVRTRNGLVPS